MMQVEFIYRSKRYGKWSEKRMITIDAKINNLIQYISDQLTAEFGSANYEIQVLKKSKS